MTTDCAPTGDVWLKFDNEGDEEATYEANTFHDDGLIRVEWYHNAVGQVSDRTFATYEAAAAWLEAEGFHDFSSGEANDDEWRTATARGVQPARIGPDTLTGMVGR